MPSSATCPYLSSRLSRGTRTWVKVSRPLSTPLSPAFGPSSPIVTPSHGVSSGWRIGTIQACTRLAQKDLKVKTALLDARFLVGDRPLYAEFETAMESDVLKKNPNWDPASDPILRST